MKLTKKQKIGVGVLGLAAAAFAMDRLVFSNDAEGSDAAQASVPIAAPRSAGRALSTEGAAQQQQQLAAAAVLARRLDEVAVAEGLAPGKASDAFRPPMVWYPPPKVTPPPTQAAAAAPERDRAALFQAAHKLTAVMRGGPSGGVAVIAGPSGGITASVGQAVDGFVLKAVRDNSVVMGDGKQQVILELSKPTFGASASTAP